MNILYFPFDRQLCRFVLKIDTKGEHSVLLRAGQNGPAVLYSGPAKLQEFQLVNTRWVSWNKYAHIVPVSYTHLTLPTILRV